ncbi:MAG: CYCXC family (seleno)protein [Nitrospinota bacterium]|jgi:hypothetical protein
MGKKVNHDIQKNRLDKHTIKWSGDNTNTAIILSALVFLVMFGYLVARSSGKGSVKVMTLNQAYIPKAGLIESRPLISPSMWKGKASEAYRLAAEIPQIIDVQYCYCDCSKNPKFMHKTLLTCYTDEHGANCDICQNEVFMSYDLYKKGYSIPDIKAKVDKEFSKHGSHTG